VWKKYKVFDAVYVASNLKTYNDGHKYDSVSYNIKTEQEIK
jgi:hypothetical protein